MEKKNVDPRDREFFTELTRLRGLSSRKDQPNALSLEGSDLSHAPSQGKTSSGSSNISMTKGAAIGVLGLASLVLLGSFLRKILKSRKEDRDNEK